MDSNSRPSQTEKDPPPVPAVHEHGLSGYTDEAVGAFGVGYEAQVAHGANNDSPGERSESELDSASEEGNPEPLAERVRKSLARAHIDAADLRVAVAGSEVRLSGTVRHLFEKAELEARARTVPGVSSLISELRVQRADWEGSR